MDEKWKVICEPEGDPPSTLAKVKNAVSDPKPEDLGGMVVYIVGPEGEREELSAVTWVRRASKNPKSGFDAQLQKELRKAKHAAEVVQAHREPAQTSEEWVLVCDPRSENEGTDNTSHIEVFARKRSDKQVFGSVAFVRRVGKETNRSFEAQLDSLVDHAQKQVDAWNSQKVTPNRLL